MHQHHISFLSFASFISSLLFDLPRLILQHSLFWLARHIFRCKQPFIIYCFATLQDISPKYYIHFLISKYAALMTNVEIRYAS